MVQQQQLDLFERIRQRYPSMSPSFRKVADYLLEHYRDAVFLPASRVAMRADVSESVVVRFAAALGYAGYPEMLRAMQRIVKSELSPSSRLESEMHEEPGPLNNDLLRRVVAQDIANLQKTVAHPANAALPEAVDALVKAGEVFCLGLRGLSSLATLLGTLLNLLGVRSQILTNAGPTLFEHLRHIRHGDVLVTFAFQRYTKRTVDAMEWAKQRGASTITITDSLTSPAAQGADVVLVAEAQQPAVFFNSYVTPVSLINALVGALVYRDLERFRRALTELEELLPEEDFFGP